MWIEKRKQQKKGNDTRRKGTTQQKEEKKEEQTNIRISMVLMPLNLPPTGFVGSVRSRSKKTTPGRGPAELSRLVVEAQQDTAHEHRAEHAEPKLAMRASELHPLLMCQQDSAILKGKIP